MMHRNRQGEQQYLLSQPAEKPSYMSVLICFVDIYIPTYFQINNAFSCSTLPIQINLTVLQNLNNCEAS